MTQAMTITGTSADNDLYLQVQRFYARQMQALDSGAADEWAATFTPDGVFSANAFPEPVRGRDAIVAGARRTADQLAGVIRRHWLGMLDVRPQADGTVFARSYALIIETPRNGQAGVHLSTLCEDVLVRDGDGWLVRERKVTRDDLR
jgi:hypothetical protein